MDESEIPNFFECTGCHALYLRKSDSEFLCDRCMGTTAHVIEEKFIIMCPVCHKYWPKHVIRTLHLEGICSCPRPNCEGILVARKIISQKIAPSSSSPDIHKSSNIEPEKSNESVIHSVDQIPIPPNNKIITTEISKPNNDVIVEIIPSKGQSDQKSDESIINGKVSLQKVPTFDGPINLERIIPHLSEDRINSLYQIFVANNQDWEKAELADYIAIYDNLLDSLKSAAYPIVENSIQFIFYIGALYGDLDQICLLCRYFEPILHAYPGTKIIFLGNYINHNPKDFVAFTLLCLFMLKFPNNVIILRGVEEIADRANLSGFWSRFEQHFTKKNNDLGNITTCYHQILSLFAYLPLIHIGSMNQGQIRIFSSASGIPFVKDHPEDSIILDKYQLQFTKHSFYGKEFDPSSQMILTSVPNETLSVPIQVDSELDGLYFGPIVFSLFLKANNLHYMVRGSEIFPEGAKFAFNSLMCSVFSASKLIFPEEKHFTSKILRLAVGQPPMILDANPAFLQKDLENTFGISDIDLSI